MGVIRFIGSGDSGGKAQGLIDSLALIEQFSASLPFSGIMLNIPQMIIIRSDLFTRFVSHNGLIERIEPDSSDIDIARYFLQGDIPAEWIGDLRRVSDSLKVPLAIRSSALLEDARQLPFAGVYLTKMIPNHQLDPSIRFHQFLEAIKLVWSSTYYGNVRACRQSLGLAPFGEQMAVLIQPIVGARWNHYFFPLVSGVARSHNYYPFPGTCAEDGVAQLALGLGKTIVDNHPSWIYSPANPGLSMPFPSFKAMLQATQTRFWAIDLSRQFQYDPFSETEYMSYLSLKQAEIPAVLRYVASTWHPENDRLEMGAFDKGPRVLNFAPLLQSSLLPFNPLIRLLLAELTAVYPQGVEIEFALQIDDLPQTVPIFNVLQIRGLNSIQTQLMLPLDTIPREKIVVQSRQTLGEGMKRSIRDIVYLLPDCFNLVHTLQIASELESVNRFLMENHRTCLLIVFGRLGSSDPWLGVPVTWPQISSAEVIVEGGLDQFQPDLSQGSHFFHNLSNLGVFYLSLNKTETDAINWNWLRELTCIRETDFLRHVEYMPGLNAAISSHNQQGVVFYD